MTTLAQDTFIRANQSGWGTSSDGNTYTHDGITPCTLNIAGNEGTCTTGGIGIGDYLSIGSGTAATVNVLVRCATDTNAAYMGVMGRYQGSETSYIAFLHNQTFHIDSVSGDTHTTVASGSFSYGANQFCWIRLICSGTTISASVWLDGNSEPGSPTLSATNSTISSAGKYGIYSANGGGTSQFDHLTVTDNNSGSTSTRTIPTSGVLSLTSSRTIPTSAALLATQTRTIPDSAALLQTNTRTIPSSGVLLATQTRTIPTSGVLLQTNSRTIPDSAVLLQANARTVPTSGVLLQTQTRTIPTSGVLSGSSLSRTIPTSAALQLTSSRSIPASGVLLQTNTRTIPDSAVLLQTSTRTVPSSGVLLATQARTIPTSAVLAASRTIPTSAVLLATQKRTIPTSAVLSGIVTIPPSNLSVYVHSGNLSVQVHSGNLSITVI